MGRKCKGSAKVAVMEKTAATAAASRKRKVLSGESELTISSSIQLKTQRLDELLTRESGGSDHVLAPCCSSTMAAADLKNEATTAGDLVYLIDRREKTESNSRGCCYAAAKMPTATELDEFFAAAETNLQRQFIDKYNYDVAKDEALEGRYEWVRLQLKQ